MQEEIRQKSSVSKLIIFIIFGILLLVLGIAIGSELTRNNSLPKTESSVDSTESPVASEVPITSSPTATATKDPTAGWKTYIDNTYSYSFKYPKDWTVTVHETPSDALVVLDLYPTGNRPEIEGEKTGSINIKVYNNPSNLDLAHFYSETNNRENFFQDASKGTEDLTISGVNAIKFKGVLGLMNYTIVGLAHNNIIIETTDNGEENQSNGIFDGIVSSIKLSI